MQTVSSPGLPSSNQLSGWTTSSGIVANGTIGPMADSGCTSGPPSQRPSERPSHTRSPSGSR